MSRISKAVSAGTLLALLAGGLTLYIASADADADQSPTRLTLNVIGTGHLELGDVPGFDEPAWCFTVDLRDLARDDSVGTVTDCLSMVESGENGGLRLIGTTIFDLPGGQLISRGDTTVQPVNWETAGFTHITGANGTGNAIIGGTGRYHGATGTVRLSGMVDLSEFEPGEVGSPLGLDCIFVIDLDRRGR